MICDNCGHQMRTRKNYCTACGEWIHKQPNLLLLWSIPIITAILLIFSTTSYKYYEENIVLDRVQKNIDYGEALATQGEFKKAKETFNKVKVDRPNNEILAHNIALVDEAIKIEQSISLLMMNLNEGNITDYEHSLSEIENDLGELQSELIRSYFSPQLKTLQTMVELKQIEERINDTNSMTKYAELFSNLSYYNQASALHVKEKLELSFTNYVISEAKEAVVSKDYEKAKSIVEFALQYNFENEQLSNFMKNSIQPYLNNE